MSQENQKLTFSPTDFVALTNQVLETAFGFVYIEGEIANFRISKNKWIYFDLKDDFSKVACFGSVYALPGPLEDGMKVLVGGRATLHPQYGFNFTIQSIQPSGEGSIKKAFDLLRAKLDSEGLFDESRKRLLPYPPAKIALVTSVESAAYSDFAKVLGERWPFVEVAVYDTLVQGENAPAQLVTAIEKANSEAELADILVITRGGGSGDDLAAFNNEKLVRAIAASRICTLVAIGHEIDESLSELAADKRASTPSNAAELIAPSRMAELERHIKIQKIIADNYNSAIEKTRVHNNQALTFMAHQFKERLSSEISELNLIRHNINGLNPVNVLKRGYAIARLENGKILKDSRQVKVGDKLSINIHKGIIGAEVKEVQ